MPKAQSEEQIDKLNLIKIKKSALQKINYATDYEKIFTKHKFDKRLVLKYTKNFYNSTIRKQTTQFF